MCMERIHAEIEVLFFISYLIQQQRQAFFVFDSHNPSTFVGKLILSNCYQTYVKT